MPGRRNCSVQSDIPNPLEDLSAHSRTDRIDLICDAFEKAWRQDNRPEITSYLDYSAAVEQRVLLRELLLVERELLAAHGEVPDWHQYATRFPRFADVIEAVQFQQADTDSAALIDTVSSEPQKESQGLNFLHS